MRKLPERVRLREAFFAIQPNQERRADDISAQKRKITGKGIGKTAEDSVRIFPFRRRSALKICTVV